MRQLKSSVLILLVVAVALFLMAYTLLFDDKSYRNSVQNVVNFDNVEGNSPFKSDKNSINKPTFNSSMPFGQEIADVLNVARQMNAKPLLVTLINGAYLQFALSWLCNTEHMGIHKQV